ncbi:MAG: endopeptidase La [Prevotellaceae bacterium]|jgi:ATP-dependent Lon protease|nr:endopeptidase La [Prevotellaceae bacterium]
MIYTSNWGSEEIDYIPIFPDDDLNNDALDVPKHLPLLPLRNAVLFPGMVMPITVSREKSIRLLRDVHNGSQLLGATTQNDAKIDNPQATDLQKVGTLAKILKIVEIPEGAITAILQGVRRFEIKRIAADDPYFVATVVARNDIIPPAPDKHYDALIGSIRAVALHIVKLSPHLPQEVEYAIKNVDSRSFLIHYIAASLDVENPLDKQALLEEDGMVERATKLLELLNKQIEVLKIRNDIQQKVHTEISQQQREYYLHNQLKTIKDELGIGNMDDEIKELREKAATKKWPQEAADTFEKEMQKLERTNPYAGDYGIQYNFLQTLLELPWGEYTVDNLDLKNAQHILDEDHFGLDQVKDRIIEHLAVIKLKGDLKSPILCLYGPPGVGKTSLGKSVARALERSFGRISLGGLHDEAEIRGHRKTYIGAMPGRIIQTIKKCKSGNPVIMLDEIDKVGNDFRGDPSSALLEVLDPEQNCTFHDNYLELDYDLSKVLFITTANNIGNIHPALRDRMEMIDMSGYLLEEKTEIAKRHLLPKQLAAHGLRPKAIKIPDTILALLIDRYTHEAGVRALDKQLAKIARHYAKKIALNEKTKPGLTEKAMTEILGAPKYLKEMYQGNEFTGVVTGLAWTANGGEILFVESSLSKGKGNLTITGNLGDVMKESATLALQYIKAHADLLDLPADKFDDWNVHIHVPEGAIPKDGPSAGVTMVTSLASAFTACKVRKGVAMTGEITLRGKVLPVGGIKEKILAAKRAGIEDIVLSADNEKDIKEIKEIYITGLRFHYVKTIAEVLRFALERPAKTKASA